MNQPHHGGRWLRDPNTGAVTKDQNTEALEAVAKPPAAEGEDMGSLSTDTSADTITAAPAAKKAKGR